MRVRIAYLGLAILSVLSGCGKSVADRKYEVVKCEAWVSAGGNEISSPNASGFAKAIEQAPLLPHEQDAWTAMGSIANGYVDPDTFKQAVQDGQNLYKTEKQNNDVSGALSFDKECVGNWLDLSSAN